MILKEDQQILSCEDGLVSHGKDDLDGGFVTDSVGASLLPRLA